MTARQAPPSAMVEAVRSLVSRSHVVDPRDLDLHVADVIAAMFDNLPREVMLAAFHRAPGSGEDMIRAAISAARAEVLGSAKGDA